MNQVPIYLDHQASTPLDPRVKAAMEHSNSLYGNPHTTSHLAGIKAGRAIDAARRKIARSIGGDARGVVFTSGATEANNLALFSVARAAVDRHKIVVFASEHSSVLEPAVALKDERFEIELLPVGPDGIVDLETVEQAVDQSTWLVSAMHVNNETGVIQPVAEIAKICNRYGALLHSDCAQSLGRLPVNCENLGADLLTLSAHKCYGPKGIGTLYINPRRKVTLKPLYHGGGQQSGLRPGTLPVPLCVGFGEACRIAAQDLAADSERMDRLGRDLLRAILDVCHSARLNGSFTHRVPGAFNVCFNGAGGDELLSAFEGIYVSSGSACESDVVEPSRVLLAYGLSPAEADASLRFCIGRFTEDQDIEAAKTVIARGVRRLGLAKRTAA